MQGVLKTGIIGIVLQLCPLLANSGPPFITDDPAPAAYQQWEFFLFSTLDKAVTYRQVGMPLLTINYGVLPDLEASLTGGFLSQNQPMDEGYVLRTYGFTDVALTLKYAFIKEKSKFPQVAFAPTIGFPTGNVDQGLGNGRSVITYPIWIQKSFGDWTSYGGGGYVQNFAPNTKNFYFEGWVLEKGINERLILGAELFNQTGSLGTGKQTTIATFGGGYNFKPDLSLLFSLSHQIAGEKHLLLYLGLYYAL